MPVTALTSAPATLTLAHPAPALWPWPPYCSSGWEAFLEHFRYFPALSLLLFLLHGTLLSQIAATSNPLTSFEGLPNGILIVRLSSTILFNPTSHHTHPHIPALLTPLYPDCLSYFFPESLSSSNPLIKLCIVFCIICSPVPPIRCRLSEVRDLCLFCSLMSPMCLEQCLACNRHSTNTCWVNEWN